MNDDKKQQPQNEDLEQSPNNGNTAQDDGHATQNPDDPVTEKYISTDADLHEQNPADTENTEQNANSEAAAEQQTATDGQGSDPTIEDSGLDSMHPDLAAYFKAMELKQSQGENTPSETGSKATSSNDESSSKGAIEGANPSEDEQTAGSSKLPKKLPGNGWEDPEEEQKSSDYNSAPALSSSVENDHAQQADSEESADFSEQNSKEKSPEPDEEERTSESEDGDGTEDTDDEDKPMSIKDHFIELRKRITYMLLFAILGLIICYPFSMELFNLLVAPLKKAMPDGLGSFAILSPAEGFFTSLKISFVGGIFVASPLIFYQIWAFVAPGLYDSERSYLLPIAFFSAFFFISGGLFCYYVVFPFAFDFFMSYTSSEIKAMLSLSQTLGFILQLLIAFGLIFELPLFVFFLARMGLITADWMRSMRRYAILGNVIIAAILTPPDVISQALMAAPLLVLYELSIFVAAIFGRKKKTAEEEQETEVEEHETEEDHKPAKEEAGEEQETPQEIAEKNS